MKRGNIILGACFGLGLLALVREFWPVGPPPFPTWDCETQEINIKTGQARYRRYRVFVKVRDNTTNTVVSRVISGPINVADIKEWHPVNQFAPPSVGISPHYRFHGALHQLREVEMLQSAYALSESNVADIARQLLIEWQTNGGDFAAGRFLSDKMMELEQQGRGYSSPVQRATLPTP